MATWFDRDRGLRSGRIVPAVVSPADGQHVFVLGAEGLNELAILSDGDWTAVSQRVNLDGFDVVSATMDTIGKIMGVSQQPSEFPPDLSTLFWFDFNVGSGDVPNRIEDAFHLVADGSIEVGVETYSPDATYCRVIPEGVGLARMVGENTPQAFPVSLDNYTFQFFINFESDVFASSTGVDATIFQVSDANSALIIRLEGVAAAHEWDIVVEHKNGGVTESRTLGAILSDPEPGWIMYTVRFRNAQTAPQQCELFINDSLVMSASSDFSFGPSQPGLGTEISCCSKNLVGGFDAMRLLGSALTDEQVADSYYAMILENPDVNYSWVMQMLLDGILYGERTIEVGESRTWTDFSVPCRLVTGETDVSFRLKLIAIP